MAAYAPNYYSSQKAQQYYGGSLPPQAQPYMQVGPQSVVRQMTMPVTQDGHILVEMPGGHLGYYEFNDDGGQSSVKNAKIVDDNNKSEASHIAVDPSLLMGMERTLFSALNVGTLVIIMGLGLTAVGKAEQVGTYPGLQGLSLTIAGILFCAGSYGLHCWRIHRLLCGQVLARFDSHIWTGALIALILLAFSVEVYFALRFPYLERSVAVEIATGDLPVPTPTLPP